MKVQILPSGSKIATKQGYVRLSEKDFRHDKSFFMTHADIAPESVDEIEIDGVLEAAPFPHVIIRQLDWMLKPNGKLVVCQHHLNEDSDGPYHSHVMVMHLIALGFEDRIVLRDKKKGDCLDLTYEKVAQALPKNDNIDSWSFGICSNGSRNEFVVRMVEAICALNIPHYEIIVCGPAPSENLPKQVRVIDDSPIYVEGEKRIPISRKKNRIAAHAKYNNMMILHDRYILPNDWYVKMKEWGNYFDMMTYAVRDLSEPTKRIGDWMYSDLYHFVNNYSESVYPAYGKFDENTYINGGMFVMKKHLYDKYPLPDCLHWAEREDIFLSRLMLLYGKLIQVDTANCVSSENMRFAQEDVPAKKSLANTIQLKKAFYARKVQCKRYYSKAMLMRADVNWTDAVNFYVYKCANKVLKIFRK